ncbi:DnaB-like helicase C-terminal domain-containing protein [Neobacillus niacini]|uniref:DnaB-like helicase C-terminal domain-containing protein n=1 Tax=Neobacillus niacini TaxID=86668 RepID=UPI00358FF1BD
MFITSLSAVIYDAGSGFECKCVCLFPAEPGRRVSKGKQPMLSNLRESGEIEQEADTID